MTIKEIKEWLRPQLSGIKAFYSGFVDQSQEYVIGMYSKPYGGPTLAVGGINNSSYGSMGLSVLLHFGKDYDVAEAKAQELYNLFNGVTTNIGETPSFFKMKDPCPVSLGKNDKGVWEFVVDVIIYYHK